MKYRLLNNNNEKDTLTHILMNRGIPKQEIYHYLNTTDDDINDYKLLGEENLKKAAAALVEVIQKNEKAITIVDSDVDGFTSAALLINYLHDLFPSWVENNLDWIMHEGKQHGLEDHISVLLECNYSLVLVPDGGSNNYKEHKELKEDNTVVIVLDHHEAEKISDDAIIINNQLSNYPNKEFSGVGVTWQFCRFLDNLMKTNYANEYLDLVALGLCADMMSLRSIETKHIMQKGFKEENIKNPFIYGMSKKNEYSLGGCITPMGAAFYIAPFINAIVRSGTQEEKKLIFESMINFKAFKEVLSNKRGHKLGETEKLWEQALRTATNVKNRQTRLQDAGMEFLENIIKEQNLINEPVFLFYLKKADIEPNIRGLCANKIMAKYQRPCIIMSLDNEDCFSGSARGYTKNGLDDFRQICLNFPKTRYAEGHANAFGYSLPKDAVNEFKQYLENELSKYSNEISYPVDYIYKDEVNPIDILSIGAYKELWGQDIDEPFLAVENLKITQNMIEVYERKNTTIKIKLSNGVSLVKFLATEEDCYNFIPSSNGYIEMNIVGRASINKWNGIDYPQIIIEDYEVVDNCPYYF